MLTPMKKAFAALLPGALVFVLATIVVALPGGASAAAELTRTYGLVVYGAGLALAWVFYRSRVFILLACLALMERAVVGQPDREHLVVALGTALMALIGTLALTRDRGLLSRGGVLQIALAGGVITGAAAMFGDPDRVRGFASSLILSIDAVGWPGVPRGTVVVGFAALLAVAYGFYRWRSPVDRALVWSLLLLLIAIRPDIEAESSALFLLATGLTLTMSVVETSYALAYRDDLTGLPGRRALMQYLDGIAGTYTVAMVDVDHFKKFNDKYGHDVGDQVLRMVASRLARVSGGGKAYRYGGEEFTLLFPGRTSDQVREHLESVRGAVAKATFSLRSWRRPMDLPPGRPIDLTEERKARTLSVTVSIGVADAAGDGEAPADVLKRADQALYRAKKGGRDRVAR